MTNLSEKTEALEHMWKKPGPGGSWDTSSSLWLFFLRLLLSLLLLFRTLYKRWFSQDPSFSLLFSLSMLFTGDSRHYWDFHYPLIAHHSQISVSTCRLGVCPTADWTSPPACSWTVVHWSQLVLAWTSSQEAIVYLSSQLLIRWCHVGSSNL